LHGVVREALWSEETALLDIERAAIHGTHTKENAMSTKKYSIYVIQEGANGKSCWNRAGVGFENKDAVGPTRL
jgi:hypothetical protein